MQKLYAQKFFKKVLYDKIDQGGKNEM